MPFPTSVRTAVNRTLGTGFLKPVGALYYRRTAQTCAKRFQGIFPASSIRLTGGAVSRLNPGISDLDFLILLPDAFPEADLVEEILTLRKTYRNLKNLFWIPGELSLTFEKDWRNYVGSGPSTLDSQKDQLVFDGAHFEPKSVSVPPPLSGNLLAYAFLHFGFAWENLKNFLSSGKTYYGIVFEKEINKVLRCTGETVPQTETSWEGRYASGYSVLKRLSQRVLEEKIELPFDVEVELTPMPSVNIPLVASPTREEPLDLSKVRTRLIIPGELIKAIKRGWHWSEPLAHLQWQNPESSENIGVATYLHTLERALIHSHLLLGRWVYGDAFLLQQTFYHLCLECFVLKSRLLTLDTSELATRSRDAFPYTVRIFEEYQRKPLEPSSVADLRRVLSSQREMKNFLDRLPPRNYLSDPMH